VDDGGGGRQCLDHSLPRAACGVVSLDVGLVKYLCPDSPPAPVQSAQNLRRGCVFDEWKRYDVFFLFLCNEWRDSKERHADDALVVISLSFSLAARQSTDVPKSG
jgi:hypothetical protein